MICFLIKYFEEHPITAFIAFLFSILILIGAGFWGISSLAKIHAVKEYKSRVKVVQGRSLELENGKAVDLIGIWIPEKEFNGHNPAFFTDEARDVRYKTLKIRPITAKAERYVKSDLVEATTLDGILINEKWLKEGKGFFQEDYWSSDRKKQYREWEQEARNAKKGVWSDPNLKVWYVRSRDSNRYHYPDCDKVKNLSENKRYDYFTNDMPDIRIIGPDYINIDASILSDNYCDFCCRRSGDCAKQTSWLAAASKSKNDGEL